MAHSFHARLWKTRFGFGRLLDSMAPRPGLHGLRFSYYAHPDCTPPNDLTSHNNHGRSLTQRTMNMGIV